MTAPLFVYGNWAAYDELSDGIELTEELAIRQFNELLRLRRAGVRFDAYLMDAFWFAKDGGYRKWRTPHWPDGPDRWFDACRQNQLLPGMWFTANTLCHLDPAPAWRDSVDATGWGMCLFHGGFLADFMDVLDHWYGRGVRLFKFDFADFDAVPATMEGKIPRDEARMRNIEAFRNAMLGFRASHPDAILLGYNGFENMPCMDRTDRPFAAFIDPAWLDVFDSLYCGDPRPADVPCHTFWRSVDIYSDHMTRAFEASEIPLDRIENCGFMAGDTGTCYWRKKRGWQAMLLLSLARGGSVHVAYGDLSLFDDADAAWWAQAQALYAPSMRPSKTRSFGGVPGQAAPYGWLSIGEPETLATVVNPSLRPAIMKLPSVGVWRVIAHDSGFLPKLSGQTLELAGNQMTVLSKVSRQPLLMADDILVDAGWLRPVPVTPFESGRNSLTFRIEECKDLRWLVVRQFDSDGCAVRTYPTDEHDAAFRFACSLGPDLPHSAGRRIWSGMSWSYALLPSYIGPYDVTVQSNDPNPVRLVVEMIRAV
jgi:hypothetical protein